MFACPRLHESTPLEVEIVPLGMGKGIGGVWTDLATGARKPGRDTNGALAVAVPARGFICWEYKFP